MKNRRGLLTCSVVLLVGLVLAGCEKKSFDHYLLNVEERSISEECAYDVLWNMDRQWYWTCYSDSHGEALDPDNSCCKHIAHGVEVFCEQGARLEMVTEALDQCNSSGGKGCGLGARQAEKAVRQAALDRLYDIGFYDKTTELGSCWAQ